MLTSFRFWGSESGSDKSNLNSIPMHASTAFQQPILQQNAFITPAVTPARPPKRRRDSTLDDSPSLTYEATDRSPSAKRAKTEAAPLMAPSPEPELCSEMRTELLPESAPVASDSDQARDAIHYQFGLEILLKHDELRLINQELAKCQVALEQLRRCHLIPYPVNCPTPAQMLEVSSGKGPAVRGRHGEMVPQWAAPYGVVDGPYARHYAKWLIPDPKFDGVEPEWHPVMESGRGRAATEGRTTRNSVVEVPGASSKVRSNRGVNQRLHSLSNAYPQAKDKAGPCILKRSDGQTVKLVCIDCQRDNFSSTQGFINHCRIAHRRDFKSHEEAAVHCGHPIEAGESAPVAQEDKEKTTSVPAPRPSGLVHPFTNAQTTDQQAYSALQSRIAASLKLYRQGKLPGVTSIPSSTPVNKASDATKFVAESSTPFLSSLLQKRKFSGDLGDLVKDAKQKVCVEDFFSPSDDSEDIEPAFSDVGGATRAPVVLRMPAKVATSSTPLASNRPTSSKGRSPATGFASPPISLSDKDEDRTARLLHDDSMDMDSDLSPNPLVSNNAPSLVSDDGEYDDSDDGSTISDASDGMEAESVSDVAEISIEEDHEPRAMRHHRTASGVDSGMGLKKDESKHVTFINPVNNNAKRARKL